MNNVIVNEYIINYNEAYLNFNNDFIEKRNNTNLIIDNNKQISLHLNNFNRTFNE